MNITKLTATFEDGTTKDVFPVDAPVVATPTETVHIEAGQTVEVVADAPVA